ncbi:MAG: HDOD domain-containing protein [Gammaproteobacteria bacterium]|nr:HDOD domain-containing protein [Gammaproteobacteria bacterium]
MNNKRANTSYSQQYQEATRSLGHPEADKILENINIPSQPITLLSLQKELSSDYSDGISDCIVISEIISKDLAVTASVIETINSPFFALEDKIDDVQGAATLLGMPNVVNMVNAFCLREAMKRCDYPEIDAYFDSANEIALVAANLANELGVMNSDVAYTLGLFHDIGAPILLQKFPNYAEVLQYAYTSEKYSMTEVENHNLNTNHAVVGFYVCKAWNLPERVSLAILNHHNVEEVLSSDSYKDKSELRASVALLTMAEYLAYAYNGKAQKANWEEESALVLDYLDINEHEFDVIKTTMFGKLRV